jgi:hypothetical protein
MERKNLDDFDANGKKGDWVFLNDETIIIVQYGDAHMELALCYVKQPEGSNFPTWQWNGSHDAPTLSPSILVYGTKGQPARWHGYLRDGKLETLEYSPPPREDIIVCDGGEGENKP